MESTEKDILRIGRNEKISDKVLKYALDEQIKLHPDYGKIYEKKPAVFGQKLYGHHIDATSKSSVKQPTFFKIL